MRTCGCMCLEFGEECEEERRRERGIYSGWRIISNAKRRVGENKRG